MVKSTEVRNANILPLAMLTLILESVVLAGAIFRLKDVCTVPVSRSLHPSRDVNEAVAVPEGYSVLPRTETKSLLIRPHSSGELEEEKSRDERAD